MSDEPLSELPPPRPAAGDGRTIWSSTLHKVCEEMIQLREMNNRQHKMFEQTLTKQREALLSGFNSFAADTQRAYQQLRQEVNGERRFSLTLLNELLDIGIDLQRIAGARPRGAMPEEAGAWADAVEVQTRKVVDLLARLGIHPYDAVIGEPYSPTLHERVGSKHMEGMGPMQVAEQRERGWASQQPDFVLRRPKIIVSE